MSEDKIHPVDDQVRQRAHLDADTYERWYQESITNPDAFWAARARELLDWEREWDQVSSQDFRQGRFEWFQGGQLNACYNCIDRHLSERADQTAIIWEGDEPDQQQYITYRELHEQVSKLANALKDRGISKGDRVCIYMPMIPEAAYAMLACARIGVIHSVVFGGFSPSALRDRIQDAEAVAVITADEGVRGGKTIPLKANTDQALSECSTVHTNLVVQRTGGTIDWNDQLDFWYHDLVATASANCPPTPMEAEDPLYILYTSGSTGKPKGVVHTTGGYLLHCALTHKYVFDYHDGDIYWCTADVGWVTGHSYIVYGPLANGAITVMFEGVPTYPDASRHWQVIDKHQVSIYYTAPTAIRALMSKGDEPVKATSRASLRILGSVGEPINPEAWEWYYKVVGDSRCPVIDTWWQTETGGIMIAPLPGATDLKPGSATRPLFGIQPALLDDQGNEVQGAGHGNLAIKHSWPGQLRNVWGNHQRMMDAYFLPYPGYYFSGDGARRDEDGYYWVTGRVDDVLNVSGHRLGTAEIESAMVLHDDVAEAAVAGYEHDVKGTGIYAYVTLMADARPSAELEEQLRKLVTDEIGAIAKPDLIHFTNNLPKTRSGKIMRRILRKIAANDLDNLGDTSTLADPSVVDQLIQEGKNTG